MHEMSERGVAAAPAGKASQVLVAGRRAADMSDSYQTALESRF
jgi:hypothetical protein